MSHGHSTFHGTSIPAVDESHKLSSVKSLPSIENGRNLQCASKNASPAEFRVQPRKERRFIGDSASSNSGKSQRRIEKKVRPGGQRAAEGNAGGPIGSARGDVKKSDTAEGNGVVPQSDMKPETSNAKRRRPPKQQSFGRQFLGAERPREKQELLKKLRAGKDVPDVDELNDVLASLCRQRRSAEAHEVMDAIKFMPAAKRSKILHNVKTFTIMIDICGKSRQLAKAFSLFYKMQVQGLTPNVVTYNAMVAACSRNNEPDLAFEVFKEMQSAGLTPDKFTYGALIDSCAKCGKVDRAFEIADIMERKKISKDQTIYSALMDACGRGNQLSRAFSVYEDMKKSGVWPNLITFSVLIDTCANAREPEKAFELFAEVKQWGFPHANVVVYTALIDACAKAGWLSEAQLVLEAMIRDNVRPNEITYGALIDGWTRSNRLDEAFVCLHEMIYEQRVTPNAVLIGGLAETARRLRAHNRAKDLWEIMVQHNVRISRIFYPALMVMASFNDDVDVAIGIAFHVFGSGVLRRCSTRTEDPYFRALADSLIFVRSKIKSTVDREVRAVRKARMQALYDSTAMSEAEMDSVQPGVAYQRCISWGDLEQQRSYSTAKRRAERLGTSKAKQARETGLRALDQARREPSGIEP